MPISPEQALEIQKIQQAKENRKKSSEEFLDKLYAKSVEWLQSRKGQLVAEFGPQYVDSWVYATAQPGGHPALGIDLEKAVLFKVGDRYFAFALGRGKRSKYDAERTLGFQFGALPRKKPFKEAFESAEVKLSSLRMLFFQHGFSFGSGELFVDERFGNKINVDAWADHWRYGGKMITNWPEDRLTSDEGVKACLELIGRTSRNGFIS